MRLADVTEKEVLKKRESKSELVVTKVGNLDTLLSKISEERSEVMRSIWVSIALIALGVILTIVSYTMAEDSGGSYYVLWGISLLGLYGLTKSIYHYYDPLPGLSDGKRRYLQLLGMNLKRGRASILAFAWSTLAVFVSLGMVGIFAEGVFDYNSYSPMTEAEFKSQYLVSGTRYCMEQGGGGEYCRCVAEYAVENSSVEQLKQLDAEYEKDPELNSPLVNNAVNACIYLNGR